MYDDLPIKFIMWYTGDFKETILECYQTWLKYHDNDDELPNSEQNDERSVATGDAQ